MVHTSDTLSDMLASPSNSSRQKSISAVMDAIPSVLAAIMRTQLQQPFGLIDMDPFFQAHGCRVKLLRWP